ncbi:MAG: membrane protein insertase YidC [Verrucomicrobiota bacterium]
MYDRKTWVVLALCGGLLAANLYYSTKNNAAVAAERARQEALQKSAAPKIDAVTTTTAELTVEPQLPSTDEQKITLESKEVIFTLTNIGGGIKHAEFKKQYQVGSKDTLVKVNHFGAGPIGGLAGAGETLENIPYAYKEDESVAGKKAVYIAKLPSGLIAKKTFSLVESDKTGAPYLLDFELKLENAATNAINLNQWSIFLGESAPTYQAEVGDQTGFFWRSNGSIHFEAGSGFKGGMISSAKSILKSDSDKPVEFAGVTNQFFATVVRPLEPSISEVWAKSTEVKLTEGAHPITSVRAGLQLPATTLNPGEPKTLKYLIFVGPKDNTMLRKMDSAWGDGWGDVMQYGWFSIVSRTLNWLLNIYHNLLDGVAKNWSWGLAIILLTITVRIVIWPLHAKSTHTMKRMAMLQPEMAKIKEKYADDPNKVNTETMGLYRKYGINPLGGCLPMFIQIPIFFGFYRMLQYAVELRGQGFLWVNDLSQPDTLHTFHLPFELPLFGASIPFNILPIVMAISSFLQIRMTPKTGDPMQQKIIMFMPFMFFFFCYNFASALALYWTTQNIFSIGQTWLMSKVPEPELKARTTSDKKSFVQRMAERQAEMEKAKKQGGAGMRDVTPDTKKKPRPPRTGG